MLILFLGRLAWKKKRSIDIIRSLFHGESRSSPSEMPRHSSELTKQPERDQPPTSRSKKASIELQNILELKNVKIDHKLGAGNFGML
jgi:hypothetical protein